MSAQKRRVFVAGHRGMVGSAIVRELEAASTSELVLRTRQELDCTDQQRVEAFLKDQSIDAVYLAAAKVGGIHANDSYPAEFIYQNLIIQCNIIHSAHLADIDDLLFLGSSCIYPRMASQPIQEDALLDGKLEPTNEPYAIAKIAGIKQCESYNRQYGRHYRSVMPTNLYGVGDNFHPENSHVVPALIRRFHEAKISNAKSVVVWGTGKPMREFLYVDDMAKACVWVMGLPTENLDRVVSPRLSHLNVGTGEDCTIKALAEAVATTVGYHGKLEFDASKPDGTPRKLLDVSKMRDLGWTSTTSLKEGLDRTYRWCLANSLL